MTKKTSIFVFCIALLISLGILVISQNYNILITNISIVSNKISDSFDGFKIAHVSDLHNTEFGENNSDLISKIKNEKPDIIAITGDLIDSRNTITEISLNFVEQALKIAPVYYVNGNHESRITEYPQFEQTLKDLGVIVLNDEVVQITKNNETLNIIGIIDPDFNLFDDNTTTVNTTIKNLKKEVENNSFTLLLIHRPELFDIYVENDIDLALTGHAHGGQIRIPFIGGIFAPDQGLFPKYDAGLYSKSNTYMYLSRGLGNSLLPLRINDNPELVIIELTKQD